MGELGGEILESQVCFKDVEPGTITADIEYRSLVRRPKAESASPGHQASRLRELPCETVLLSSPVNSREAAKSAKGRRWFGLQKAVSDI